MSFMRDLSIRKIPGVGRVHERLLDSIGVKVSVMLMVEGEWEDRPTLSSNLALTDRALDDDTLDYATWIVHGTMNHPHVIVEGVSDQ